MPDTPTGRMRHLRTRLGGAYALAPLPMAPPAVPYGAQLAHVQSLGDMGWCTWDLRSGAASWSEHVYVIFDRAPEAGPMGLSELRGHVEPADLPAFDRALRGVLGGTRSQAGCAPAGAPASCARCSTP